MDTNGSESEIYADPTYLGLGLNPFTVAHGQLTISATPADDRVKAAIKASTPTGYPYPAKAKWVSGMISTQGAFAQRYGYFEARMKLSAQAATWPAFWLAASQNEPSEEIDIMEALGDEPRTLHTSWHTSRAPSGDPGPSRSEGSVAEVADMTSDFHTYGLLWTPTVLVWYFDDAEVWRAANPGIHDPLHIILNLAMDGDWNAKSGHASLPSERPKLTVKFIEVYGLKGFAPPRGNG